MAGIAVAKPAIYNDIEISNSDETGISFVLSIDEPSVCLNSIPNDSGFMAVRSILIGIPGDNVPFISQAVGSDPIEPGQLILPAGNTNLAEIVDTKTIRGQKVVSVNIYPFYQGSFFRRIEVTVDFRQAGFRKGDRRSLKKDKIFDAIFRSSILNYDQFINWPSMENIPVVRKPAVNIFGLASEWYKIETVNEGLIKVTGSDLVAAGVPLSALNGNAIQTDALHIFYGGGKPLVISDTSAQEEPEEIAILVNDGGDGYFNAADNLIFFAQGADSWRYPDDSLPIFIENHYTNINCYWLAVSGNFASLGKRMTSENGNPTGSPDSIITQTTFYTRQYQNKLLYIESDGHVYDFYNWYWTNEYQNLFGVNFPNAITGAPSIVRARARARDMWLTVDDSTATEISADNWIFRYSTDNISRGYNSLRFDLDVYSNVAFDYYEIAYQGELIPGGNSNLLDFSLGGGLGICEIIIGDVNNFSVTPQIFDLSDPFNPIMISSDSVTAVEMKFEVSSMQNKRYYICPMTRTFSPYRITQVISEDLRAYSYPVDMIVIAPEEFIPYLEDYETYREGKSNVNILRVAVEDIMNQFSNGLYDPMAIREFLKYAYYNYYPSSPPSAVLLVGDGVYDYENNLKTGSINLVPPCIHAGTSIASDDNYVFFGQFGALDSDSSYCDTCSDRGYDMMIARWPVRNVAELNTVIEKVMTYESATGFGPWRTTVTLVADDEYKGTEIDNSRHTEQIENLQKYHLPAAYRRNKIYLWSYPYDSYGNKPAVNDDIVRSLNDGTLVIDYVGHGNPDTWAHEHVFNRGTDLQRLNNADKLALFFAASCSIGFFDEPSRESMAEELLRMTGGGSIGSVSATRLVFSPYNAGFNNLVFDIMFGPDRLSICQSVFAAKLLPQLVGDSGQIKNDQKYAFFGDPLLKLGIPQLDIHFTDYPDSLVALATHEVSGEIVEFGSGVPVDFTGTVEILVYDTDIEKTYKGQVQSLTYSLPGPLIFRGEAEAVNGSFTFSFIAPLDIGYGGEGARISAYAMNAQADAFGLLDSLPVSLNISSSSDSVGPSIAYTFSTRQNFVSGDKITADENLRLSIADSSGINLAGSAGHAITLIIDNDVENVVNLTDLFQYDPGSFTAGEIEYKMGQLPVGDHRFKVKAWDNVNNSSVVEFEANVAQPGSFALEDLLNFPNPMREETMFSFVLTAPAREVNLEIFTLSGKRILNYESRNNIIPADYHEFYSWNGRDADGDRVATGVYIYKVTAFSQQSDEVVESFGKVVVIN